MPLHTTSPRILKQAHMLNTLHKIPDPGKAKPEGFDAGLSIALVTQEDAEHGDLLALPTKNVSLAEWFNASKENGNDEDSAGALHAGIQAGGSATGSRRPEHRSGGQDAGRGGTDAVQLGQGGSPGQAHRR